MACSRRTIRRSCAREKHVTVVAMIGAPKNRSIMSRLSLMSARENSDSITG